MIYTVILSTNPVNPGDAYRRFERTGPESLSDVVQELIKDIPCTVKVGGVVIQDLDSVTLNGGEFVEIVVKAEYANIAAAIIKYYAITGTIATFLIYAVVYIGFTAIVAGISRSLSKEDSRGQNPVEQPVYSVENGFNQVKEFAAVPRMIGRRRVYPDLSARPFTELYIGPGERGTIISQNRLCLICPPPVFGVGTWLPYDSIDFPDIFVGSSVDCHDQIPENAELIDPQPPQPFWLFNTALQEYTSPVNFELAGRIWINSTERFTYEVNGDDPANPPPATEICWSTDIEYEEDDRHQRMTTIFNAGWGDVELIEPRIRDTNVEEYKGIIYEVGTQTDVACELRNYPRSITGPGQVTQENTTQFAVDSRANDYWPEDVWTEPGAGMRNNDDVKAADEWWIERTSPRDTIHCQIDITGKLHSIAGGVGLLTATFTIEYAPEGSGAWVAAPGSPLTIGNDDLNVVQHPFSIDFPNPDYWDVRIRQDTPDATDGNQRIEMSVSEFKFQRNWIAHYPIGGQTITTGGQVTYPANTYIERGEFDTRGQNRIGIVVQANEQLQGRIDKYDVIFDSRTWTYIGGGVWDGTEPGTSANWVWDFTSNPADWFLNEALGGFYNSGAQIAPLAGRGWNLGPSPDNGEPLFGAGLEHSEIDYASILLWRDFCVREDLHVDAWAVDTETVNDFLHKIAAVGRGSPSWWPGKLGVVWEEKYQAPTAMYNAGNILIDSFSISYISEELPDAYRGTYSDETDNRYEQQHVLQNRPDLGPNALVTKIGQVDLWGVTRPEQARRVIRLEAARTVYQRRRISWRTSEEGFHTIRGDVVLLAHDVTRWAIGSRLVSVTTTGGVITEVELTKPEKWDGSGPLYAWIRHPDGTIMQGEVQTWTGEAEKVSIIGGWFPAVDGPEYTDQDSGTGAGRDCLEPQDFLIQIGPSETPGKKVRVVETNPKDDGTFEIVAIDEVDDLWAHDVGTPDWEQPTGIHESGEHIEVCASNCSVSENEHGDWYLEWEGHGAEEFTVSVSVNGGPWTAGQSVYGRSVEIPKYDPGTVLNIAVCPCVDATDQSPYPSGAVPTQIYSQGCCNSRYVVPASLTEECK